MGDENKSIPLTPTRLQRLKLRASSLSMSGCPSSRKLKDMNRHSSTAAVPPLEIPGSEDTESLLATANVEKKTSNFCSITNGPYYPMKVASYGDTKELESLLLSDPNRVHAKDAKGWTCLHHAAAKDKLNIIDLLLDFGSDIDAKDNEGNTPLYIACDRGKVASVRHLFVRGADGNTYNNRNLAAVHVATAANRPDVIKVLAEFPDLVDINALKQTKGGNSLHIAAYLDHVEAMEALIDLKIKYVSCNNGTYPLNLAAKRSSRRVMKLLLDTGEKFGYSRDQMLALGDREHASPLHDSVNCGDYASVELCLEFGASVDIKQADGATPFHHACSQGSLAIVKLMLEKHLEKHGVEAGLQILDIKDACDMTPLHRAALFDHAAVAEYLLEMGAAVDTIDRERRTPLQLAAQRGGAETLKTLIRAGANIAHRDAQDKNVLHFLVSCSSAGVLICEVRMLCDAALGGELLNQRDSGGCTPLHIASKQGNLKVTEALIQMGASVITRDNTEQSPLHFAARFGRFHTVRRLLESPFCPNIINESDGGGLTPLHMSSQEGHTKVVQHLLFKGAIVHKDHCGRTPLHLAAEAGYNQTVKLLLSVHPNLLSLKDRNEQTALHYAARANRATVAETLLSAGCEYDYDVDWFSPMDLAIQNRHVEVGMVMVKHERWDEILYTCNNQEYLCPTLGCIQYMPQVCKAILDRCIERSCENLRAVEYYKTYNFRYLQEDIIPPQQKDLEKPNTSGNVTYLPLNCLNKMVEFGRLDLLLHPLCHQYLKMKWMSYGSLFYFVNLFIYLCFLFALTTYSINMKQSVNTYFAWVSQNHSFLEINHIKQVPLETRCFGLRVFLVVFLLANIVKEVIQILHQRGPYFVEIVNYIEWVLYCTALYCVLPTLIYSNEVSHLQGACGIVALFMAWFNLLLYLQKLESVGLYVVMFLQIWKTMMKVICTFTALFVAFGLTFYGLLGQESFSPSELETMERPVHRAKRATDGSSATSEINGFHNPIISIIHTVMQMMGNWDFIGIYVRPLVDDNPATLHFPVLSFVFLLLFVIVIPILFINLLIGLAVGDIEYVQKDAQLKRLAMEVAFFTELELKLPRWLIAKVDKPMVTIYPNKICGRSWFRKLAKALKLKFFCTRQQDLLRQQLLPDWTGNTALLEEMEKQKKKIKFIQNSVDKQYELMRLIVQKMEIKSEADDYDEGVVPKHGLNFDFNGPKSPTDSALAKQPTGSRQLVSLKTTALTTNSLLSAAKKSRKAHV